MPVVYILECSDGTLYTGAARNLEKRLKQHRKGKAARYTSGRRPVKLVYSEYYKEFNHALRREAEIKKMPRHKKDELVSSTDL